MASCLLQCKYDHTERRPAVFSILRSSTRWQFQFSLVDYPEPKSFSYSATFDVTAQKSNGWRVDVKPTTPDENHPRDSRWKINACVAFQARRDMLHQTPVAAVAAALLDNLSAVDVDTLAVLHNLSNTGVEILDCPKGFGSVTLALQNPSRALFCTSYRGCAHMEEFSFTSVSVACSHIIACLNAVKERHQS